MTPEGLGAPFKPSFGLSGVVADPILPAVSLGAMPRDLQFRGPFLEAFAAPLFINHLLAFG